MAVFFKTVTRMSTLFFSFTARDEKPPKVIMTSKSFDSVTLSFDHFAPKGYKHGYVAMVSNYVKCYEWNFW